MIAAQNGNNFEHLVGSNLTDRSSWQSQRDIHPEHATTSDWVETADKNRAREPSSPVISVAGRELRQMKTRQSS